MELPGLDARAETWLETLGLSLDAREREGLVRYAALLQEWNERVNLTAIRDLEGIVVKHFLDSFSVLGVIEAEGPISLIDIGSGAGFPGMVLALVRPEWSVTLLEATRKKVDFLEAVATELGLENVRALWGRAEEIGQDPAHRAAYDVAVARAVAELPVLAEYCLPLVRVGGCWVAQKGPALEEEMARSRNAMGQLGGRVVESRLVEIPGMSEARSLLLVEKMKPTPRVFPRRPGVPARRPL